MKHFLTRGDASAPAPSASQTRKPSTRSETSLISIGFDESKYLAKNPDVAAAIADGRFTSGWQHYQLFGLREGRSGQPASEGVRVTKAMGMLDRSGQGLEIGPSYNPIAPKSSGYKVHVVDHLDTQALRAKFSAAGHRNLDVRNIEDVDFVWNGQPLPDLVGGTGIYDWIVASHVVEHMPDLVGFLQQCESILNPAGRLSLIIPDRRYCFDHFGVGTSTGELLDAWSLKRKRPSAGKVFDHIANAVQRNGAIAWDRTSTGTLGLSHRFEDARSLWERALRSDEYMDIHSWRFTPASFRLIISDLCGLGLINLGIIGEYDTFGCEFYVTMARIPVAPGPDRLQALAAVREEK